MTELADIPEDPAKRRKMAEGIWRSRRTIVQCVSGDHLLRWAAAILGRQEEAEAFIAKTQEGDLHRD